MTTVIPLRKDLERRFGAFRLRRADGYWTLTYLTERHCLRLLEFKRPKLAVQVCLFDEHVSLELFGLWIRLGKAWRDPHECMESWGFSFANDGTVGGGAINLHLNWGRRYKIINCPWRWDHLDGEHAWLMHDGVWVRAPRWDDANREALEALRYRETAPYHYMLDNGETQTVQATVEVERRAWKRRCLPAWLSPKLRSTTINVRFDGEVGPRAGSWKGGTVGCGYDMEPGEEPLDTLRRMQGERRFR